MQVNITKLIDDVQCYQTVRELRWPDGVACPSCESKEVIKRGFDDTEPARQRYACHNCDTRFDDLTDTIFAGHHQPLKVWVLLRLSRFMVYWATLDRRHHLWPMYSSPLYSPARRSSWI